MAVRLVTRKTQVVLSQRRHRIAAGNYPAASARTRDHGAGGRSALANNLVGGLHFALDDITNWLYVYEVHRISASSDVFHVIADSTRRHILDLLSAADLPARDLGAPFRISQPAVSKHLAVLRAAGLVSQRQEGGMRVYRLEAAQLQEVFDWVRHYEQFWDRKLEALGRYLDRRKRGKR